MIAKSRNPRNVPARAAHYTYIHDGDSHVGATQGMLSAPAGAFCSYLDGGRDAYGVAVLQVHVLLETLIHDMQFVAGAKGVRNGARREVNSALACSRYVLDTKLGQ